MIDPITTQTLFKNFAKEIEKMNTRKMMNTMEERLFTLPLEREVIADFVNSKGDRFIKEIENGVEKTIIINKDGTHYCGTMKNGKVAELSATKPGSLDPYVLSSLPDGGCKEKTGDYKDSFTSKYDKNGKLVELIEKKFDVNNTPDTTITSLTLDDKGNLVSTKLNHTLFEI